MQTAVELLLNELEEYDFKVSPSIRKRYIEICEQQITDAYGDGLNAYRTDFCNRDEYFAKTYGSKGSDEIGSSLEWNGEVTNGNNVEKVPNVVEDVFNQELFNYFSQEFKINLLNTEMHDIIDIVKRNTSSQTEISDEEIEKAFTVGYGFQKTVYTDRIEGAKWYREQLKSRQC